MGLHALMNQDQFHASQSEKAPRADPSTGWKGVTRATPLKVGSLTSSFAYVNFVMDTLYQ